MRRNTKSFARTRTQLVVAGISAAAASLGCSAEPAGADGSVTQAEQPITGGTLVLQGDNTASQPFGPVVELDGNCTATKIGTNRFITAAHCLSNTRTSGTLTNALDQSGTVGVTFKRILPHPSTILAPNLTGEGFSVGDFDVALFDINETTSFPVLEQPSGRALPPGIGSLTLIGYGCDNANVSHNGKEQKATITITSSSSETVNTHYATDASAALACSGDSGGPLVGFFSSKWELVGVVSSDAEFTRVGTVAEWIANPVTNDFSNNSTGYLLNAKQVGSGNQAEVHCASDGPNSDDVILNYCDTPSGLFTKTITPNFPAWRLLTSTITTSTGGPTFKVLNRGNGLCLSYESNTNAADLTCVADTAGPNTRKAQSWAFVDRGPAPNSGGTTGTTAIHAFWLVNQLNNQCLGMANGSSAVGSDVRLFPCNAASTDQLWVFTR